MDKFENYIESVLKDVGIGKRERNKLEEDIRGRLEALKEELLESGHSEEEAELEAIRRFGETAYDNGEFKGLYAQKGYRNSINGKSILRECISWIVSIVGAIIISLSIRSYVFASTEIEQSSMENTLFEGHRVVESKLEYYYSSPQRGDIVIINQEPQEGVLDIFVDNAKEFFGKIFKREKYYTKRLIKRIIGIPGDVIDIKEGKVFINGQEYDEPYVIGKTWPKFMEFPVIVPEDMYFVLGDNRENSMDSRDIGFIPIEKIEGKVVWRIWPLDKFGRI